MRSYSLNRSIEDKRIEGSYLLFPEPVEGSERKRAKPFDSLTLAQGINVSARSGDKDKYSLEEYNLQISINFYKF